MTIQEIREVLRDGKVVYWTNEGHHIIRAKNGDLYIKSGSSLSPLENTKYGTGKCFVRNP